MQYLLTEGELRGLVKVEEVTERTATLEAARLVILQLSGFACIHRERSAFEQRMDRPQGGYCDDCPLHTRFKHEQMRLLCTLPKEWSK